MEALGAESEWAGDFRVPLVALRQTSPQASWGMHALPKAKIEYIRAMTAARFTLKAEHEAELAFRKGPDDHESKLEAELRHIGSHSEGWQLFVRTAALAAGALDASLTRVNAMELAAGIRRNVQASRRSSGSVELRIAHRDHTDGGEDFDRLAGMLHVDGAVGAGSEALRFGVGPAIAALW